MTTKTIADLQYGDDVWVYTFTGWEKFYWDSPAFETFEDAFYALECYDQISFEQP